jgi:hypothetical protein
VNLVSLRVFCDVSCFCDFLVVLAMDSVLFCGLTSSGYHTVSSSVCLCDI